MLKVAIVGASGYTGCELVDMILNHKELELGPLYVSAGSEDAGKPIADLYGKLSNRTDAVLQPLTDPKAAAADCDAVFFATAHKVSHDLAPIFYAAGCAIFDLSGAFRVNSKEFYPKFYGFEHEHQDLLDQAIYALCEWCRPEDLKSTRMISLPGCYTTASQLALKPLVEAKLLDLDVKPVINAVSGVTGAGRKAKLNNSFCEVSLNAYGLFNHRHRPEIEDHLGIKVIFNPHLGPFKRGILATITARVKAGVTQDQINACYQNAYHDHPLVRLKAKLPRLMDVVGLPYCDIGFALDEAEHDIVICSAIDNLLKGASAQGIQALNLHYGFNETEGLF